MASGDQRACFGRTVLPALLGTTRRQNQTAAEAAHVGEPQEVRGCHPILKPIAGLCWNWHGVPLLRPFLSGRLRELFLELACLQKGEEYLSACTRAVACAAV